MIDAELTILNFIQEHMTNPVMDKLMVFITTLGDAGIIWIITALIMISCKKYRRTGITLAIGLILSLLIGNIILKPLVARTRPFEFTEKIRLLIETPHDFSFPSGHTIASFEAAVTLMICDRRRFGYAALGLAFVIAFSRLYLCVHYPTDVLTSIILGSIFAVISYFVVNALYKKFAPASTEVSA